MQPLRGWRRAIPVGRTKYWAMLSPSLLPDAVEVLVVAVEELAVADGERGVGAALVALDLVVGQELELGIGGDHVGAVLLGDVVELAVGQHRGGPDLAGVGHEAFGVDDLTGGGFLA